MARAAPFLPDEPVKPLGSDYAALARAAEASGAGSRYRDRPLLGARVRGMAITLAIYGSVALIMVIAHLRLGTPALPPPETLPRLTVLPLAAPPEPIRDVKQGEERTARPRSDPAPPRPAPPIVSLPILNPVPQQPVRLTEETTLQSPPVPETTAPQTVPAPPAPALASNARESWEAKLLAHLERYRRFPSAARARREQGVVHIQFRMNRAGTVLAMRILRPSGSAILDQAGLDTIRRAQPLPAIPQDRPDELELAVPIEFFLRN